MVDHGGRCEGGIGSTHGFRDVGMSGSEALDVHFIDDRFVPGRLEQMISAPGERLIDDDTLRHVPGVVLGVE